MMSAAQSASNGLLLMTRSLTNIKIGLRGRLRAWRAALEFGRLACLKALVGDGPIIEGSLMF